MATITPLLDHAGQPLVDQSREEAWTAHFLARADAVAGPGGAVPFRLGRRQWADLGPGLVLRTGRRSTRIERGQVRGLRLIGRMLHPTRDGGGRRPMGGGPVFAYREVANGRAFQERMDRRPGCRWS